MNHVSQTSVLSAPQNSRDTDLILACKRMRVPDGLDIAVQVICLLLRIVNS